jgi:hypothetical protein
LRISTRCCRPTGQVADGRIHVDLEAVVARGGELARTFASPPRSSAPPSAPSITFSTTVRGSTSMKCWWHHADADPDRIAEERIDDGSPLTDLAGIRLVEAVEDRHQGRLPRRSPHIP